MVAGFSTEAGGGVAATAGGGAAGGVAAWVGSFGSVARTAVWQPADSFATLFWRQTKASLPPGVTPEQCDMKSERQFERIALCWAEVTWALALAASAAKINAPRHSVDA